MGGEAGQMPTVLASCPFILSANASNMIHNCSAPHGFCYLFSKKVFRLKRPPSALSDAPRKIAKYSGICGARVRAARLHGCAVRLHGWKSCAAGTGAVVVGGGSFFERIEVPHLNRVKAVLVERQLQTLASVAPSVDDVRARRVVVVKLVSE